METSTQPQHHWLFAGISEDILRPVLAVGRAERFLPGDVIFDEGDESDGLYLVLAGVVRVTARGANDETFLGVVRAGETLGEMGLLDGEPRSGSARALTMCATYFVPMEPFLDLLEGSTQVCMRLLALVVQRLRSMNSRISELPGAISVSHPDEPAPL